MKKKFSARINSKLHINQETLRRLSDLDMRRVNGGFTSGHITCDSGLCASFEGDTCN